MKKKVKVSDVIDYMNEIWMQKSKADEEQDYQMAQVYLDRYCAIKDAMLHCIGIESSQEFARACQESLYQKKYGDWRDNDDE